MSRLQELSLRCVDTYTSDDIIKHLEEECKELLLSIDRLRRDKGTFDEFYEELVDVSIECNTVIALIDTPNYHEVMLDKKLDKFESALNKDKRLSREPLKERYRKIEL
jgi:hypothetical protein